MKFIKFDTLYPDQYLTKKILENKSQIQRMDFDDFTNWLISLRLNFSDYYSHNLQLEGWEAKEFFVLGKRQYLMKCGNKYFGPVLCFLLFSFYKIFGRFARKTLMERLIDRIISVEKPDVLFIREQTGIRSTFWDKYRDQMLVVSRMECGVPKYWSPACFDVIYTNILTYRNFFLSNRFTTYTNYSGFDERVCSEINMSIEGNHEVVFVGGLGKPTFLEKTEFLESVLRGCNESFEFSWWGYKEGEFFDSEFPLLAKCYKGVSGGLEMFTIYKKARIVLNDYGIAAGGQGMNQRIYEVLGAGGFLLTRNSPMFNKWEDTVATFDDVEDCLNKINYYLSNEEERIKKVKKGHDYVIRNFNYKEIMKKLSAELHEEYEKKFGFL